MELESYFEFLALDDIRIKGTRIGIETVLDDYLNGASSEEIAARYRNLTLEQVYATIIYYLNHQEQIDAYLEAWRRHGEGAWLNSKAILLQLLSACKPSRPNVFDSTR